MDAWKDILTVDQIVERHELTAKIDPSFARDEREFWETRIPFQLRAMVAQAWDCNDPSQYQLARSYAALRAA